MQEGFAQLNSPRDCWSSGGRARECPRPPRNFGRASHGPASTPFLLVQDPQGQLERLTGMPRQFLERQKGHALSVLDQDAVFQQPTVPVQFEYVCKGLRARHSGERQLLEANRRAFTPPGQAAIGNETV